MASGIANKVNEDFFMKWTPELSYVLGLLATDGYLGDRVGKKRAYQVQLVLTDKEIIEYVSKAIGFEGKIYYKKSTKAGVKDVWGIKFGNKIIFERLVELGITPRKSHTLKLTPVPDHLFSHYFRGVFDGDGSVTQSSNSRMLRIYGVSPEFHEGLRNKVKSVIGIEMGLWIEKKDVSPMHVAFISKYGDLHKIYNWMYDDVKNNLWLERKREKLERYIKHWSEDALGFSVWNVRNNHSPEELRVLHIEDKISLKAIAKIWGVKYISIRNVAKEWGITRKKVITV